VDAHNHLASHVSATEYIDVFDQVGIKTFINVTGNVEMGKDEQGYYIKRDDFTSYRHEYMDAYPGRFEGLTMAEFARWENTVLIEDDSFAETCLESLEADIEKGAKGLKITKELGLRFTDYDGNMVAVDDERLSPIWKRAGELSVPVLIHTSDPVAFFYPADPSNEHYINLKEFPGWSFYGSHFSKDELIEQRDHMIGEHPDTTFICPHVANYPEDLEYVSRFLDEHPNAYIDISARLDELGRQPYTARDFLIAYQDRVLFGVDMPGVAVTPELYRCYFRFLETRDEYFEHPNPFGEWRKSRWRIYGVNLPDEVLKKIYYKNALAVFPGIGI
jgi:predicted TIM-barrel fold metal-dependent hydrolase